MTLLLALGDIALRPPSDDELVELAQRAARPDAVLPASQARFVTWIAGRTPSELARQRIARVQANRDLTRRPGWTLGYRLVDRHHVNENGSRYAEGVYQLDRDARLESPVRWRYRPTITGVEGLAHLLEG